MVAKTLIKALPRTVVRKLLDDGTFSSFAELSVIGYGDVGSFRHGDIVSAIEAANIADGKADLTTRNGRRFVLTRLPDGKGVALAEDGVEGRLIPELGLLDPEREYRLAALADAEGKCWPGLPSVAMWRSILMERPLGEIDLARLISEIRETPSQFLAVLERKWKSGEELGSEEFFPRSLVYYTALVGPPPDGQAIDDWIDDTLIPDLKTGIERSLSDGLRRALALNVDSRLSPVTLVVDVPAQELLLALSELVQLASPFALLGILEVALARVGKEREFTGLVSDALDRLFGEQSKTNGIATSWSLLPALIRTGLGTVGAGEELYGYPPFWRRLAAHAHANVLVELLDAQGSDVDRFVDWLGGLETESQGAVHLMDLRDEPLWRAWDLSPRQLQASVVARLRSCRGALEEMGLGGLVDSAVDALQAGNGQFNAETPGPMVGVGTRMADLGGCEGTDADAAAELFLQARAELDLNPTGDAWKGLSVTCRLLRFDGSLLDKLAGIIDRVTLSDGNEGSTTFFETLLLASDVAATQPYEPIADKVAAAVIRGAGGFSRERDVVMGLRILVISSGAMKDRAHGMEWLASRLSDYAFAIPRGQPCRRLLSELDVLQTLLPIRNRCFGKARKVAAAGME